MPKGVRHSRSDEIQDGEFIFLRHDVQYGHDGIKNLRHFVPLAQNEWHHFDTQGHQLIFVHDSVTSRVGARIDAVQGATRTSIIRKRIILPNDFGNFPPTALKIITKRSTATPVHFQATLFKNGVADPGISSVNVQATVALTFELKELTPTAAYSPGDFVTLELECETDGNDQFNEVSDIEFQYITARGNV